MRFSHIVERESQTSQMCVVILLPIYCLFQSGQEEDEQMQRPEVREEDLTETKNKLGLSGPAKSKTITVMEECGEDTCRFGTR